MIAVSESAKKIEFDEEKNRGAGPRLLPQKLNLKCYVP